MRDVAFNYRIHGLVEGMIRLIRNVMIEWNRGGVAGLLMFMFSGIVAVPVAMRNAQTQTEYQTLPTDRPTLARDVEHDRSYYDCRRANVHISSLSFVFVNQGRGHARGRHLLVLCWP